MSEGKDLVVRLVFKTSRRRITPPLAGSIPALSDFPADHGAHRVHAAATSRAAYCLTICDLIRSRIRFWQSSDPGCTGSQR